MRDFFAALSSLEKYILRNLLHHVLCGQLVRGLLCLGEWPKRD